MTEEYKKVVPPEPPKAQEVVVPAAPTKPKSAKVKEEKIDASLAKHMAYIERKGKEAKAISALYTEGKWLNYINYECVRCPYSSISEASIREHVRKHM